MHEDWKRPQMDPTQINNGNVPIVLGSLVTTVQSMHSENRKDLRDLKEDNQRQFNEVKEILADHGRILEEHEKCLEMFRFSQCKVLPWINNNKWLLVILFSLITFYFSTMDWLNRWLQWTFAPPRIGP
jgi:hypothetical protein